MKCETYTNFFIYLQLYSTPGGRYVRRRYGEEYHSQCIVPTVKFGGGSTMIWGCMTAQGVGEVYLCEGRMNSARYIDMLEQTLEPSIVKFYEWESGVYRFQQDNAPCHKSKLVMRWFQQNNVPLLEWPPQSPDLSPIENLWYILKENIRKHKASSHNELKGIILQEWQLISPELCNNLVCTMPKRVKAVIKAKGGSIKY